MAFPILLLLAGGVLVLGKKKKRSSVTSDPGTGPGPGPGPRPGGGGFGISARPGTGGGGSGGGGYQGSGQPWDYCPVPGNLRGEHYAAFASGGKCHVFWTPETRDFAMQLLDQEFSPLSGAEKQSICKDEAKLDAVVANVVLRLFPQLDGHAPPAHNDRYFPKMVWDRVKGMFLVHFCNMNRVT